ncbi:peroxisomal sarcosine oxidase isoform X1 [Ahaetulla prasina]|uniref:peroxisomal sarcosine oxidase isoform X1 n=1 Tax=Ahaetulla prasina TaxID=499056 RepID=UPI002649ECEF|nr:peroxisomal sarcosine oxidase isoform X1 [Ahaetulla prasina]
MAAGGDGGLFDALVLGAGIQGSCAAYHLARRRLKTLLLDQFPLPHTRGSSHGQSRISRSAYPQDRYLALMAEAKRLWAQLEAESGTQLHRPMLALVVGRQENPEFQSYRRTMERHRLPCEILTPQELANRFPGIQPYGGEMAVTDPTAGVLYANKALRAVQDLFQRHRGVLRDGEKVLQILPGSVVTVTTSRGKYQAKRLVVTAGAWTNQLLAPLGLQLPLQPLRIRVCYLRAKVPGARGLLGHPPCFLGIGLNQDDQHFYGLQSGEYPDLMKVCYHHGSPTDPDKPNQKGGVSPPVPDLQRLQDFVSKYLPGLDPEPAVQEWCLYTNTPDRDFILDRHPRFENIVIGAGFSGHGFKFAPVVGKILCELSLGEQPTYDLTPFRLSRFQEPPKANL